MGLDRFQFSQWCRPAQVAVGKDTWEAVYVSPSKERNRLSKSHFSTSWRDYLGERFRHRFGLRCGLRCGIQFGLRFGFRFGFRFQLRIRLRFRRRLRLRLGNALAHYLRPPRPEGSFQERKADTTLTLASCVAARRWASEITKLTQERQLCGHPKREQKMFVARSDSSGLNRIGIEYKYKYGIW